MKKKNAFTLAEVLITLGIIGIVAAMTLPTLIQKHQKKVIATRLKQTYSQLYQAINMAQVDYGDMKNWDVNDNYHTSIDPDNPDKGTSMAENFAEKYIKPYLKYSGNPGTFNINELGYSGYTTKSGQVYWSNSNRVSYIIELVNGVTLFIGYNAGSQIYSFPTIFVDVNGKTKPNQLGRDFFMFSLDSVNSMKLIPANYGLSRDKLLELCSPNPSGKAYDNLACTALIYYDSWEIKDDYPW